MDLGTLPGGVSSQARAINNRGDVVGVSTDESGATTNLGTLEGGTGSTAVAINRRGEVAGTSGTTAGPAHAVLWTVRARNTRDK